MVQSQQESETLEPVAGQSQSDENVLAARNLSVWYGNFRAVRDINLDVKRNSVLALIGPSGCGKSTLLRCFNRMNDLVLNSRVEGQIIYNGTDLYAPSTDSTEVRARVGMVFQKPNPFPKTIFENVAFGLRVNGFKGNLQEAVERSLRQSALWEEVKDRLNSSALELSGGQQQRLCIARALAVEPEVILMDEPCSALDPVATLAIEDLIRQLVAKYTIIIVTHNMQQAARVSHETAFLMVGEDRAGYLVEMDATDKIFTNPSHEQTEAYITGRFS
ncbi:MAG: phosphate ABC transporter ATP-binding protein PstB [Chloroflexi bacterium]|nr:phosphate ABC transporter ATP-binding protein PstB [Chloroflexota bacterium]